MSHFWKGKPEVEMEKQRRQEENTTMKNVNNQYNPPHVKSGSNPNNGNVDGDNDEYPRNLTEMERGILWEINLARGCLESFKGIVNAQAIVLSLIVTVNLIGFLQPPKGSIDEHSRSVMVFCVFNSLSLYAAISGLLFYIYCSYSTVVTSLGLFEMSGHEKYGKRGVELLHRLRTALRQAALPSLRRRSKWMTTFLAFSLFMCVGSYISSGIAATPKDNNARWYFVVVPAIPGCGLILFILMLVVFKIQKELDFETRIEFFWRDILDVENAPSLDSLSREALNAIDPIPAIFGRFFRLR